MSDKPTYEELEQKVKELEKESLERRKIEDALRESEEKYRQLVKHAPTGIYEIDYKKGKIISINDLMCEYSGYTREELLSINPFDLLSEDSKKQYSDRLEKILSGEQVPEKVEFKIRRKDGQEIWALLNIKYEYEDGSIQRATVVAHDINDRKKAEEALLKSEEKYRELANSLPQVVFEMDENGVITFANRNAFDFFGYTQNDLDKGINALQMLIPEHRDRAMVNIQVRLNGEKTGPQEYTAQRKDGSTFQVIIHVNPILRENRPVGLRGIMIDITERKLAEEELQKLASVIKYSSELVNLATLDGKMTFLNKAGNKMLGIDPDEVERFHIMEVIPDHLKEQVQTEILPALKEGNTWKGDLQYRNIKTGEITDVHAMTFTVQESDTKKPLFLANVSLDISDRIRAEEALRESEEKYRTVLEASPDPFIVYDIEGKVIYFNPAFTRVFGRTLEERLGKKMDVFVPKEAWPETKIMIENVLAGKRFSGVETLRYTKNGTIIPVSVSGAVYKDRDGNPMGSVINLRDISEQKKLESQLQQAQKMESLGTLAGGIAHDFNNLLMGIQGRTSLMLMDTNSSHPHSEHLKGIEDYIKSAAGLTKQLLGFARGGKYEVKPTDLNELIKRENKMFGRTRKEINIQEKFEKNLWTTDVDQGQIEQVLLNIYVNAWHAMPGGGDLYIQTENIIIDENYTKPYHVERGKHVKISISDTGVGMGKEMLQRIFDPFFTTKEMGRGTGLGLASAYGIIKNHSGYIDVHSEKGKGTTFEIYLPASEKKVVKEEIIHEKVLKGSDTILLVDDQDIIIDVGRSIIEKIGYEVLVAKSGKEAIAIYKKNQDKIDMVILDMIMPEMSGADTYDKLKEINLDIKVLLSSGYSINGQASEILDRGCNGFIQKPFKMEELSKKIREILDGE